MLGEIIRRAARGAHTAVAVNAGGRGRITAVSSASRTSTTKEDQMAEEYRKLTREELNELAGEELPERAAMSLINANLAIPVNAAVAANVLSDNAVAYADAKQYADIDQSN
jgi:hypothetical protein